MRVARVIYSVSISYLMFRILQFWVIPDSWKMFRVSISVGRNISAGEKSFKSLETIINFGRRFFSSEEVRKTCLYELHVEHQGRKVLLYILNKKKINK